MKKVCLKTDLENKLNEIITFTLKSSKEGKREVTVDSNSMYPYIKKQQQKTLSTRCIWQMSNKSNYMH